MLALLKSLNRYVSYRTYYIWLTMHNIAFTYGYRTPKLVKNNFRYSLFHLCIAIGSYCKITCVWNNKQVYQRTSYACTAEYIYTLTCTNQHELNVFIFFCSLWLLLLYPRVNRPLQNINISPIPKWEVFTHLLD